jgi:hypothetical protein
MKKLIQLAFCLFAMQQGLAQVNVFDCNVYNSLVTQPEIMAVPYEYNKQCILFDQPESYWFTGDVNRLVRSATSIVLKPGFHAGPFTSEGELWLQIKEQSSFDVAVMNYADLNNVLRLKKLEIRVSLPTDIQDAVNNFINNTNVDKINPFVDNAFNGVATDGFSGLDVEIVFTHITSGQYRVIDAFYYRDFERNESMNDWNDVYTDYPIRCRFAPPKNGEWTASVIIKVNQIAVAQSQAFKFNVVESGSLGYVKVHENNRNLQRGNRIIFPVGHNFPNPMNDVAQFPIWFDPVLSPSETHKAARMEAWKSYIADIERYANMGGKYIRTIQSPWSSLIEFEKRGNYYDRLHYAWEQDNLMDLCEEKDILVMFNLMIHEPFMKYGDYWMSAWDWDHWEDNGTYNSEDLYPPYCYNTEPGVKQVYEMFTNQEDLYYHTQRTRYYISRYGYSTNIYEFELLSEPYHINEFWAADNSQIQPINGPNNAERQLLRDAMLSYNTTISSYIKNNCNQLVGINYSGPEWTNESVLEEDPVSELETIDVIGMNMYSTLPNSFLITKTTANNITESGENSYYARVKSFQDKYGKPVVFPEFGPNEGYQECSNFRDQSVSVMTGGFMGIAGYNMWDGFVHPNANQSFDEEVLWPSTIRTQHHMNANDVINTLKNSNGNWIQGRQMEEIQGLLDETESKETQYYISSNQNMAVGYVRNRSYNIHSNRLSDECWLNFGEDNLPVESRFDIEWNDGLFIKRLKIEGLKKNKDYRIDWYDFETGNYMMTQCQNTQNTNLILEFPSLEVETHIVRPVLWFVVSQLECNKVLIQENLLSDTVLVYKNFDIEISPNPFNRNLKIVSAQNEIIQILTSDGRIVKEFLLNTGDNFIELENLQIGIYHVFFTKSGVTRKIVKL